MKTCSLNHFMEAMQPWLADDYLRSVRLDASGQVVLEFTDGVQNVYAIDDCSRDQVKAVLQDLTTRGIHVEF